MSITTMSMNTEKIHRWTDHKHCSTTLNDVLITFCFKSSPLNCAICRCSSCVGRKSSWEEILPGLVATWVTQYCRHASSERDRATKNRKKGLFGSLFFSLKNTYQDCRCFLYLRLSQTRRRRCSLPCLLVAAGTPPRTAPCTPPSAATFHSHTLSTSLRLAPSQRSPHTGPQNRTGPGCDGQ